MANNFNSNPIQIDSASGTRNLNAATNIAGIIVIASGDNWSCILKDASGGDVIFRADSNIANHRSVYFAPTRDIPVSDIYVDTLTNISLVLVYVGA